MLLKAGIADGRELVDHWATRKDVAGAEENKIPALFCLLKSRDERKKEAIVEKWVHAINEIFLEHGRQHAAHDEELRNAKEALQDLIDRTSLQPNLDGVMGAASSAGEGSLALEALPKFSSLCDRKGYNARFVSRNVILDIQHSHFLRCKPLMIQSMTQLGGTILSMDTTYDVAARIFVTMDGKSFKPWKGMTTIKNEHNETIWWAMVTNPESLQELDPSLQKLVVRLRRNNGPDSPVQLIYVDTCCHSRKKLVEIFGPNIKAKLDGFHWLQRWNDVLLHPSSKEAGVFRAAMSRALYVVADAEFEAKRQELRQTLGREPSALEVVKECNKTVPQPDLLEPRIRAVIFYFLVFDDEKVIMRPRLEPDEEPPKFTFKSKHKVEAKLTEQLKHVACLSDEPGIPLHFQGANGTPYTAQSSSQNELGNKTMNKVILQFPRVGMVRGEQMIWSHLTDENQGYNVTRRGATDHKTKNVESLALANSLAEDIGYETIFEDVSMPSGPPTDESLGFDIHRDMQWQVNDLDSSAENEDADVASNDGEVEDNDPEIVDEGCKIYGKLEEAVLRRDTMALRRTCDAFFYAAGDSPWVPLDRSDDPIKVEEHHLFAEMVPRYNRKVSPSAKGGFNEF